MTEESGFDKDEAIFLSIMYTFHAAAMQQMGKIANPLTGKVERDLDAARGTIDVLVTFQKKTKGNLSERESRTLTNLITELQLNYVDETKKEPGAPEETAAAEGAAASADEGPVATPPPADEAAAAGDEAEEEKAEAAEAEVKEEVKQEKEEGGKEEKGSPKKKAAEKGAGAKKKKEE